MEETVKLRRQLTRTRIALVVLLALCFMFFVYAFVQKLEADRNVEIAEQNRIEAQQIRLEAEKQHDIAIVAQENASRLSQQLNEAIRLLEECQKNRK